MPIKFSVIICTYSRPHQLKNVLSQLCRQMEKMGPEIEIIVANNNSPYPTPTLLETFAAVDKRIKHIFVKPQGKSYALNAAIKMAQGDWLIFTDDDVVLSDNWLLTIQQVISQNNLECCVGRVLPRWDYPAPEWYDERMGGVLVQVNLDSNTAKYLVGANMIIRRNIFEKYGYFNEAMPRFEDSEFSLRIAGQVKITYKPEILICHPVSYERLQKDYFRQWYYDMGRLIDVRIFEKEENKVFDVPRWVYRAYVTHQVGSWSNQKPNDQFFHELQMARFQGLFKAQWAKVDIQR